jgi:predicted HicB family RNase H-like nuclease
MDRRKVLENLELQSEKKSADDGLVAMYVRIDASLKVQLEQAAKQERRSLASYVEQQLRTGLLTRKSDCA